MSKKLVILPDQRLRRPCRPVKDVTSPRTQALIAELKMTLAATPNGVGLAAPQIGAGQRVFVVRWEEYQRVFVNPRLSFISKKTALHDEGCLSIPGYWGKVRRADSLRVKARDEKGEVFSLSAKGFLAQIVQHELDHLNGVLFIDRAKYIYQDDASSQKKTD